jgi:hypothetical protein
MISGLYFSTLYVYCCNYGLEKHSHVNGKKLETKNSFTN